MRTLVPLLLLCLITPIRASEDEALSRHPAIRGLVHDLLAEFRSGDEAARRKASAGLLARGEFVLPWVRVAAEATPDEKYRDRLLALAAGIAAGRPGDNDSAGHRLAAWRSGGNLPGFAEYPAWDVAASNLVKNRWRAAAEDLVLFAEPPSPGAALIHIDGKRWGAALECLIAFARENPDRIEESLVVARWSPICDSKELAGRMAVLEGMANRIVKASASERASMVAFHVANLLRSDRLKRLRAVAETWGTEEGGLWARHELIEDAKRPGRDRLKEQLELCAKFPGTGASFKGLTNAVFQLRTVNLSRKDYNSVARLRALADVVALISSEEFPGGAGCIEGTGGLINFYISRNLSPEDAKVLLEAYRVFFAHHFLVDELADKAPCGGYHLESKFTRLHGILGVPKEEMGPVLLKELAEIERQVPEKAPVRCFAARLLAEQDRADEALEILRKVRAELPDRFYGRKALAVEAAILYTRGDFAAAAELYDRYVRENPTSAYAWVAALRVGHARARAGEFDRATTAWERARAGFPGHPLVSVLVPLSLGRAFEERGILAEAIPQYRAALTAWPTGCKDGLGTPLHGPRQISQTGFDPDATTSRDAIQQKIAEFDRPGIDPAQLVLHLAAKRHWARGDARKALETWRQLLERHPDSPLADEVRATIGRMLIGEALVTKSREEAEQNLVLAAAEGDRFTKFAAELFRSITALGVERGAEIAKDRLGRALADWDRGTVVSEPDSELMKDVAAIRRLVFRPENKAFFHQGYRPDSWPAWHLVSSEIEVVFPDGSKQSVVLRQDYPDVKGVISFQNEEIGFIKHVLNGLGGDRRTKPAGIMALPRPEGAAKTIREFINPFFRLTPGHWRGWHVGTFPKLNSMSFLDAERTEAIVKFRVRYRGGEAKLVRGEDGWRLLDVKLTWME